MTPDQASKTAVGSGPSWFVSWTKDDRIALQRCEDFQLTEANFKTLVWRVLLEPWTRTAERALP